MRYEMHHKFKDDLNMFNTKRDIVSMIAKPENIIERVDVIEEHFRQEFLNNQQRVKVVSDYAKLDSQRTHRKTKHKQGHQDKAKRQRYDYTDDRRSKNKRNRNNQQVININQPVIQNYKQEVESINQILSREIVKINNKEV